MTSLLHTLRNSLLQRSSLLLLFAAVLLALMLQAKAQVVGGSISGTVTDDSGSAIAGAVVVVHNDETGTERTLTTDPRGHYAAPSLTVGRYEVSASANGFAA